MEVKKKVTRVVKPSPFIKNCSLHRDSSGTYFIDQSQKNRFDISEGVPIEYQGSPIELDAVNVDTLATLHIASNKAVDRVSITFLQCRKSLFNIYQEGVIVFSELKFPIALLVKEVGTHAPTKLAAEVIASKCSGIRKVNSQGGAGFWTALGLAYLDHLALYNVDWNEFGYFNQLLSQAGIPGTDPFMGFMSELWNHKTSGNGPQFLDTFHSQVAFQENLTKAIKAVTIAYAKNRTDSEQLQFLENGVQGLEAEINYAREVSQLSIAFAALALPIKLIVLSLETQNLRSGFDSDTSHPSLAYIYLLRQYEAYYILYSKEHIDVEGYMLHSGTRGNAKTVLLQSLYYTRKVKEAIKGVATQEEFDKKRQDLFTQAEVAFNLQNVISFAFQTLNLRSLGEDTRFFDGALLMQTYEAKANYKKALLQLTAKPLASTLGDKLTALESSHMLDNLELMKRCDKCEAAIGDVLLECKHYLCARCFRNYAAEFLGRGNPSIVKPSGDPVDAFLCPVSSCSEITKPISKRVIEYLLGTEITEYVQKAEVATGKKKCQRCALTCPANLFFLLPYCGCKICAYCQNELMKTNGGVCMCGYYVHQSAIQSISMITETCKVCNNILYLIRDFTLVRCDDHMICTNCLEKVMKTPEPRCTSCYRIFAPFETEKAKPFFLKQCFLFCGRVFNHSGALDLPCSCHYCQQCAESLVFKGADISRCFSCRQYFPQEFVEKWKRLLMQTHVFKQMEEATKKRTIALQGFRALLCSICQSYIGMEQNFQLSECGHTFHRNCIGEYGGNIVSGVIQADIQCPQMCGKLIPSNQLQQAMKPQDFIKYSEALVYLKNKLVECPNCRSQYAYERVDVGAEAHVVCQNCKYHFCGSCKKEWSDAHDFKRCKFEDLQTQIHMLEETLGNNPNNRISQCPGCKTPFMKDDHCDHIRCPTPNCIDWCFLCSAPRAPTLEHHMGWHRPDCPHCRPVPNDPEPMKPNCPECAKLGRRCDPPKQLKVPGRFDFDEY